MTALSANITDSQTLIPVDAGLTNGTFQYPLHFTADSEAIRVIGRAHESTWLVDRGIAGTTAATHLSATSLTRYYPDGATGGGGGAIAVTDGTTTVDPASSLTLPPGTVTDEGGGVAAFQPGFIVSASDPGAVGAGVVWKDISGGIATAATWWERNAANTGWDAAFYQVAEAATDDANVGPTARNTGTGNAIAGADARNTGSGDAIVNGIAESNAGSGDAYLNYSAEAGVGNYASAFFRAKIGGTVAGMTADVDGGIAHLAFNDATPIAKPIVPLTTPDAQDVIDALVALGLITQSD